MEMDGCCLTGPTLSPRMTRSLWLLLHIFPLLPAVSLSGWQLQPPWEMVTQALIPTPLLHVPILLKGVDEEFLLAQGRFGSDDNGDAITPPLPASSSARILTFRYAKVGAATLQVLMKEGEFFRLLDSITEQTGSRWQDRTTLLPAGNGEQQLYFRVRGILDGLDAVAVSSIQIKSSPATVLSVAKNIPKGIRRKPISKSWLRNVCDPIQCSFEQSSCRWSFTGFTPLDGKVVSKENGVMSSEPILQPANAHFQMEIFVGEHAAATVHQQLGSEEQLLWTAGGVPLPGWNTVRLPLRFSVFPSRILIKSMTLGGGYVAVRNTRLVNEFGTDIPCGLNVSPIRPKNDGPIRLTAVQRDPTPPSSSQGSRHVPLFAPLSLASTTAHPTTRAPPLLQKEPPLEQGTAATFMKSIDVDKLRAMAQQFGLSAKAITPVNEPAGYIPKQTNPKLALTSLNLPASLQKALSDKLSQIIELPPSTSSRESRPFSRQNMDWIVSHSFNSFMNHARP